MVSNYSIFRFLTLITSSWLLLWYYFDIDLLIFNSFKFLNFSDKDLLTFISVLLLLFFSIELSFEWNKSKKRNKIDYIQFYFTIILSISTFFIVYNKIVINTFLESTNRYDLLLPISLAVFLSIVIHVLYMKLQILYRFSKKYKKIFTKNFFIALCHLFIITLIFIFFYLFNKDCELTKFVMRYSAFIFTFLLSHVLINSKNKASDKAFNVILDYVDRIFDIKDMPKDELNELKSIVKGKKHHKKIMSHIQHTHNKYLKSELQKYKHKFQILKDISIDTNNGEIIINDYDPEEPIVELTFSHLENKKLNETHLLKSKYFKESADKFKSNLKNSNPKNVQPIIDQVCRLTLDLQRRNEFDPNTILVSLIHNNSLDEIKEFINKKNPDLNQKLENGWSPLLISVADGYYDKANYLLQKGADPDISNKLGATPLGFAAQYGNHSMCKLLLSFGAKVNKVDIDGTTALMRATMAGHGSIVKYLLDQGADSSIQDNANMKALDYAIKGKFGEIAKILRKLER